MNVGKAVFGVRLKFTIIAEIDPSFRFDGDA
jgi:hypothetical protein